MAAIKLTDCEFDNMLIVNSNKPILIDFWAPWCGPCKNLSPIIDELSDIYNNRAIIFKMNIDENPKISDKYNIRSIPTLIFFKNGKEKDRCIGLVEKEIIIKKLKILL